MTTLVDTSCLICGVTDFFIKVFIKYKASF